MQRHVRGLEIAVAIAITAFILSIVLRHYMLAYATAVMTFFVGGAYIIAVAKFRHRMDPDEDETGPKPPRPTHGPRPT